MNEFFIILCLLLVVYLSYKLGYRAGIGTAINSLLQSLIKSDCIRMTEINGYMYIYAGEKKRPTPENVENSEVDFYDVDVKK